MIVHCNYRRIFTAQTKKIIVMNERMKELIENSLIEIGETPLEVNTVAVKTVKGAYFVV